MASWMVHLRVADQLLGKLNRLCETEFIVGNIAPDSGVPNADWSAFSPNKVISHFQIVGEDGKKKICTDSFLQKYFSTQKRADYDEAQYSFYLGYLTHLLTDRLWMELVFIPTAGRDAKAYAKDPTAAVWKWKEDWYDLDFLYLREHPDFHAFAVYEAAEGFQNIYMDEFSQDAFDNRRRYITGYYRGKRDILDRAYPYLTKEQMDAFTNEAAERICKELGRLLSD